MPIYWEGGFSIWKGVR